MLHMVTQRAWALMPKAASKGGRGERCPLSFSAPILLPHVGMLGISLHRWKTEARSPQPWYWKCRTLMGIVVKVGDTAFQGSCILSLEWPGL